MRNIEYDEEEKRAENVTLHSKRHTQASGDDTQRSPEQRVTDASQRLIRAAFTLLMEDSSKSSSLAFASSIAAEMPRINVET